MNIYQALRAMQINGQPALSPDNIFIHTPVAAPKDSSYIVIEEGSDIRVKSYFRGGGRQGNQLMILTVSLWGPEDVDAPEVLPIYRAIQELPEQITSHPLIHFSGIELSTGSMRPIFDNKIHRAYAAIRFDIAYRV